MRKAIAIELDELQREKLVKLAHSNTTEVRVARRASIVLLAASHFGQFGPFVPGAHSVLSAGMSVGVQPIGEFGSLVGKQSWVTLLLPPDEVPDDDDCGDVEATFVGGSGCDGGF